MAQNKNALIRYKTIDNCLQNRERNWTLDDLIMECSKVLSEKEGEEVVISKRSVQLDIQMMRSAEMGYNAPIAVFQRKYYRYTDRKFSIVHLPITQNDQDLVLDCLDTLTQYEGFDFYEEIRKNVEDLQDLMLQDATIDESNKSEKIIIEVDASKKEKVMKKPLHKSQKVKKEKKSGNVVFTFETKNISKLLEKLIPYGSAVKVISPKQLKKDLKKSLL